MELRIKSCRKKNERKLRTPSDSIFFLDKILCLNDGKVFINTLVLCSIKSRETKSKRSDRCLLQGKSVEVRDAAIVRQVPREHEMNLRGGARLPVGSWTNCQKRATLGSFRGWWCLNQLTHRPIFHQSHTNKLFLLAPIVYSFNIYYCSTFTKNSNFLHSVCKQPVFKNNETIVPKVFN